MFEWIESTLPVAATEAAKSWDQLYYFLLAVCVFFTAVVIIPMLVFIVKYRFKPGRKVSQVAHNTNLEIFWTAIPTVVLMVIFAWGWIVYKDIHYKAPSDAMEIRVVAKSWNWTFQYEDGRTTQDELYVPVDKPVKLTMTSQRNDVLHSFFVPNFRIKKDLVPGLYTSTWFQAKIPGVHQIFCTEYCGLEHWAMVAKLKVLSEEDWKLWWWGKEPQEELQEIGRVGVPRAKLERMQPQDSGAKSKAGRSLTKLAAQGREISKRRGCQVCHSNDGSSGVGPSYKGLFGSSVALHNGMSVEADENYIRESIENPQAKIVSGYQNVVMPPYPGQLTELELNALIAYIKSVK